MRCSWCYYYSPCNNIPTFNKLSIASPQMKSPFSKKKIQHREILQCSVSFWVAEKKRERERILLWSGTTHGCSIIIWKPVEQKTLKLWEPNQRERRSRNLFFSLIFFVQLRRISCTFTTYAFATCKSMLCSKVIVKIMYITSISSTLYSI